MLIFLNFIAELKRRLIKDYKKYNLICIGVFVGGSILSILTDLFIPWTFIGNIIRCLIAVVDAAALFSLFFGIRVKFIKTNVDTEKDGILKYITTLSHKQRVNVSIILFVATIIMFFLLTQVRNIGYTITASIIFTIWIGLFYFIRPTYDEIVDASYGFEDIRDIKAPKQKAENKPTDEDSKS